MDFRERNYQRVEVTSCFDEKISGKIWTYIGTEESENRFEEGSYLDKLVIYKEYLDLVLEAYKKVGYEHLIEFIKHTEFHNIPIRSLIRVDT